MISLVLRSHLHHRLPPAIVAEVPMVALYRRRMMPLRIVMGLVAAAILVGH